MQEEKKIETQVVDNKLKTIVTTITTNVVENSVDLDYLNTQKNGILAQKQQQTEIYNSQMALRDKEVAEIDQMILECRKAGLKTLDEIAEEKRILEAQKLEDEKNKLENQDEVVIDEEK